MKNDINTTEWRNPSSASPIFIVGCQRSGTTLLRAILHSHPELCIGYECAYYKKLADKYYNQNSIKANLGAFLDDLYNVKRFNFWNLDRELLTQEIASISGDIHYPQVILLIAELYRQQHKQKASKIGFKNPNGIFHIPFIFELFPNAKIIHIVRDVRGVYASEKKKAKKRNAYDAGFYLWKVSRRYKVAMNAVKKFSNHQNVYTLYYKDVVNNTEKSISNLLEWIEIDYHSEALNYHKVDKNNSLTPDSELWQHSKTLEAPDSNRVNAFLKELSCTETEAIELLCFKELRFFRKEVNIDIASFKGFPLIFDAITKRITKYVPKPTEPEPKGNSNVEH